MFQSCETVVGMSDDVLEKVWKTTQWRAQSTTDVLVNPYQLLLKTPLAFFLENSTVIDPKSPSFPLFSHLGLAISCSP